MFHSRFFVPSLVVVALALSPTCWLPAVSPPVAHTVQGESVIARQGDATHLVYGDTDLTTVYVRYARWGGAGDIAPEDIDTVPFGSIYPGIAVGTDGVVHATYIKQGQLMHARRDTGSWSLEALPGVSEARVQSLALDADDRPLVAWQEGAEIRYARWLGLLSGGWTSAEVALTLPPQVTSGGPCSDLRVVDTTGGAALAASCPGEVVYAKRVNDQWVSSVVMTFLSGVTTAADLAGGPPGGSDLVFWCDAGSQHVVGSVMKLTAAPGLTPYYLPETQVVAPADCTARSTGVARESGTTYHAAFVGPDDTLRYVGFSEGTWGTPATFCSGPVQPEMGAPGRPQNVGVVVDAAGVSVTWGMAGKVHWTRSFPGSPGTLCGW